jgi:hypothetical protein
MRTSSGLAFSILAVALAFGCDQPETAPVAPDAAAPPTDPPEAPPAPPTPEPPSILRDVSLVDDDAEFNRPYVPGHRTTMDGRVALRVQGGPPGNESLQQNFSFYLFAPEKLSEPILTGPAGAEILADSEPFEVPFPPALEPDVVRFGHHAICDPTENFPTPGERPNPYPCGPGESHDCYDITIVSSTSSLGSIQLWGTAATIEVSDPKTPSARIVDVTLGEPVAGTTISSTFEFMEPAVTSDGRLLTGRLGRAPREWTHPETGETLTRHYDLVYLQLPDDAAPCDVTGWTTWHPMSHAPYDPRMVGRYGLAAYPFRDTEGNPIPDGEDLGGTYPWVDREGANVFMTGVHGTIAEQSETRYPRRCVVDGCEELQENVDWDRGFMVGGLWTHGKFVHLDGMINSIDWAVGVSPAAHWMVDLYRTADGAPVEVRFGSGRFIGPFRRLGGPYPPGYTHNPNILDSLQHLFNYRPEAETITPHEVVWIMSSGVATDEISFDDLSDASALIVSNMQASITQLEHEGELLGIPRHHNGQVRTLRNPRLALLPMYLLDPDADEDIHLQNAATSLGFAVPPYGRVRAGTARVEPVALGGVKGRGFWMSGEAEIVYAMPAQTSDVLEHDYYVSVFVDARAEADESRGLLRFPDGSEVHLSGDTIQYLAAGAVIHEVALPPAEGWRHLGLQLREGNREVTLFVDGLALDRFRPETAWLVPSEGDLIVGPPTADGRRFRGWIDDFKLLAHAVNPEVACNHARGTLIQIDDHPEWASVASRYPAFAHAEIAEAAGAPADARFACYHDYRRDHGAHLANIPAGTRSVRDAINFPEGPIRLGAPRPDSTSNAFCTTCHTAESRDGLSLSALELRPDVMAEDDPRRQPHQPPRRVFGNVPAGWIPPGAGPGSPDEHLRAPPEGLLIDAWVLPGAE